MNLREISNRNFRNKISRVIKQTLQPPPKLKLSDWADTYRVIPAGTSSIPGRWRTDRAEYQREILDTISDDKTETVVLMIASQVGKSEALLNILGYFIHNDPSTILFVQDTVNEAQKFSSERITKMFRDTPELAALTKETKEKGARDTMLMKQFLGGTLYIGGANSPSALKSISARVLLCDEVDRYPASAGSEGNPVSLAINRTTNYEHNRKIVLVSSPGDTYTSEIYARYLQTDQREYQIRCVHCDHYFVPKWDHVKWNKVEETGHAIPETAMIYCPDCGAGHTEGQRFEAMRNGRWIKNNPTAKDAGFKASQLISPFVTIKTIVKKFVSAIGKPGELRVFFNNNLGEPYEDKTDGLDDIEFLDRLEEYGTTNIPEKVLFLTAGVDVQSDRLEMSVWGWGRDLESWHIEHVIVHGNPTQVRTWIDLKQALLTVYKREDGAALPIEAACIDSGHEARAVYEFTRANNAQRWYAVKGKPGASVDIWPKRASYTDKGKMYSVGIESAKDSIAECLKVPETGPGFVHFSNRCDPDFFSQLTSERKVYEQDKRGMIKRYWKLVKQARNEAWDCFVYALAARQSLGTIDFDALELNVKARIASAAPEPATTAPAKATAPAVDAVKQPQTPVVQPATQPTKPALEAWQQQLIAMNSRPYSPW
ncbi:phage terminase large subunit family protein [Zoogloea sp.]|uniref:phage terminase large subunit family protein n=1 Tax=Zoogloea sp. TaxID=49181 RepID=UPI001415BE25|nr:MAG: phage terminase large subunit family protein [Zoogloea sp.]